MQSILLIEYHPNDPGHTKNDSRLPFSQYSDGGQQLGEGSAEPNQLNHS
jgi:hypothetical protein